MLNTTGHAYVPRPWKVIRCELLFRFFRRQWKEVSRRSGGDCHLLMPFFYCQTAILHCGIMPQLQANCLAGGYSAAPFTYMGEFTRQCNPSDSACNVKIATSGTTPPCSWALKGLLLVKTCINHFFLLTPLPGSTCKMNLKAYLFAHAYGNPLYLSLLLQSCLYI